MTIPAVDRGILPIKVVTAEQMRDLDRRATEEYGIPSLLLMENAGLAVFEAARDLLGGRLADKNVVIVAGPGNNGGDGFAAARHLSTAQARVTVAYYGDRAKAKGDALTNIEIAEKMGISIEAPPLGEKMDELLGHADLVIDALLGTGTKGEVREPFAAVLERMWKSRSRILSVDIPSGIDADTGAELGRVATAAATVTFGLPKLGLVVYPGRQKAGNILISGIGMPDQLTRYADSRAYLLTRWCALLAATPLPQDSNKGDYGHVAIVAGSVGMTGAAVLAAMGALRIGAGLVTAAVPESLNDIMEVKLTEAMTIPVPEGSARAFGMASLAAVLDIIGKCDSAVIGPGFGRDEDTVAFTLELLKKLKKPAIVDADALFAISTDVKVLKKCKAPLVITPHPGEMARLLGTTVEEVQSNRLEVARSFAKQFGVTVVLKGAGTVVAHPDGLAFINATGTPGMATGGTGDVLSGMIGALLARSGQTTSAACASVYLHGKAGEAAAEALGERSMLAGDLAEYIPDAIRSVLDEESEVKQRSDVPLAQRDLEF